MRQAAKTNSKETPRIKQTKELLALLDNRFYWLAAMVKQGKLSEAEAGYITFNNERIV